MDFRTALGDACDGTKRRITSSTVLKFTYVIPAGAVMESGYSSTGKQEKRCGRVWKAWAPEAGSAFHPASAAFGKFLKFSAVFFSHEILFAYS